VGKQLNPKLSAYAIRQSSVHRSSSNCMH